MPKRKASSSPSLSPDNSDDVRRIRRRSSTLTPPPPEPVPKTLAEQVFDLRELRPMLFGAMNKTALAVLARSRKDLTYDVAQALYKEVDFKVMRYRINRKEDNPRRQIYWDAIRTVHANLDDLTSSIRNAARNMSYKKHGIDNKLFTSDTLQVVAVINAVIRKCRNISTIFIGDNVRFDLAGPSFSGDIHINKVQKRGLDDFAAGVYPALTGFREHIGSCHLYIGYDEPMPAVDISEQLKSVVTIDLGFRHYEPLRRLLSTGTGMPNLRAVKQDTVQHNLFRSDLVGLCSMLSGTSIKSLQLPLTAYHGWQNGQTWILKTDDLPSIYDAITTHLPNLRKLRLGFELRNHEDSTQWHMPRKAPGSLDELEVHLYPYPPQGAKLLNWLCQLSKLLAPDGTVRVIFPATFGRPAKGEWTEAKCEKAIRDLRHLASKPECRTDLGRIDFHQDALHPSYIIALLPHINFDPTGVPCGLLASLVHAVMCEPTLFHTEVRRRVHNVVTCDHTALEHRDERAKDNARLRLYANHHVLQYMLYHDWDLVWDKKKDKVVAPNLKPELEELGSVQRLVTYLEKTVWKEMRISGFVREKWAFDGGRA